MKAFRTPLILLAVLLVLGGLAYWDEQKTAQEEKDKKLENRLYSFELEAVKNLTFFRRDAEKPDVKPIEASFQLVDGVWRMTSPIDARADQAGLENLVKNVAEYKYERVLSENGERLAEYGLDNPVIKISFDVDGEKKFIELGHKAPVGYSVYVRDEKNKIYLGSQYILTATMKTLDELRDKTVARIDSQALAKFSYESPSQPKVEIVKGGDKKWQITSPSNYAADESELFDFIGTLNRENAIGFIDSPSEAMRAVFSPNNKETAVIARLTWQTADGASQTFTVMENNGDVYGAYDPDKLIYRLAADAKSRFKKTLLDFRDRDVFVFDSSKVEKLVVDGKTYVKDADSNAWVEQGDEKKQANEAMRTFLVDLEFAKAKELLDLGGALAKKLEKPDHVVEITVGGGEGGQPKTVAAKFWKAPDAAGTYLVERTDGTYLYRVESRILAEISPDAARDKAVQDEQQQMLDHGHGHDHGDDPHSGLMEMDDHQGH